jgi:hypothetical protein
MAQANVAKVGQLQSCGVVLLSGFWSIDPATLGTERRDASEAVVFAVALRE